MAPNADQLATASDTALVATEFRELDEQGRRAAIVRFNRPDQLNAISWDTQRELARALQQAESDPSVRAVLITGRGRAFSAGGDIKAYARLQADAEAFTEFVDEYCQLTEGIRAMTKPVVALINGVCAAGGLELALACDFAWAAESARIGDMHINFAQIGGAGALARLPRAIGTARALELFFSGRMLNSAEALSWGIVNRVFPDESLLDEGIAFAGLVATKSPTALHYMKKTVTAGAATDLRSALKLERDSALEYCVTLPDSMEGIRSFIEKRDSQYGPLR
jgi:enoyl-CoA hydratase/carnithine racemase